MSEDFPQELAQGTPIRPRRRRIARSVLAIIIAFAMVAAAGLTALIAGQIGGSGTVVRVDSPAAIVNVV